MAVRNSFLKLTEVQRKRILKQARGHFMRLEAEASAELASKSGGNRGRRRNNRVRVTNDTKDVRVQDGPQET